MLLQQSNTGGLAKEINELKKNLQGQIPLSDLSYFRSLIYQIIFSYYPYGCKWANIIIYHLDSIIQ